MFDKNYYYHGSVTCVIIIIIVSVYDLDMTVLCLAMLSNRLPTAIRFLCATSKNRYWLWVYSFFYSWC